MGILDYRELETTSRVVILGLGFSLRQSPQLNFKRRNQDDTRERVEAFHKVILREGQFILDNEMRTVGLNIRVRVIVHEQKAYLSVMTNGELTGFQRLNIKEDTE